MTNGSRRLTEPRVKRLTLGNELFYNAKKTLTQSAFLRHTPTIAGTGDGESGLRHELGFTTALAAALLTAGCGKARDDADGWVAQGDTAVCTDRSGNRVADNQCARQSHAGGVSPFLWYFLARNAVIPPYGERVRGGGYARMPGRAYGFAPAATQVTRAGAISRGGFGASARSFGSGRS